MRNCLTYVGVSTTSWTTMETCMRIRSDRGFCNIFLSLNLILPSRRLDLLPGFDMGTSTYHHLEEGRRRLVIMNIVWLNQFICMNFYPLTFAEWYKSAPLQPRNYTKDVSSGKNPTSTSSLSPSSGPSVCNSSGTQNKKKIAVYLPYILTRMLASTYGI
jgi:hypothetical protein